jgi:hypothetical protein
MASKAQAQDITTAGNGTVEKANIFQLLVRKMAGMATLAEKSGAVSGEDIIPILVAETEAEMWDADNRATYNAKTLSGCALQIIDFEVKFSDGSDESITTPFVDPITRRQMYLLVRAFRINNSGAKKEINLPELGEVFTWNTSARNIVGKFFWMLNHGWFDTGAKPVRVVIEGTGLAGGKKSVEKLKEFKGEVIVSEAVVIETSDEKLLAEDAPF